MKEGDTFTIGGFVAKVPNPAWRWWKFWLPREIADPKGQLQVFRVVCAVNAGADFSAPVCAARQYSDQMCCDLCGLAWDMNDPEPPQCGLTASRIDA